MTRALAVRNGARIEEEEFSLAAEPRKIRKDEKGCLLFLPPMTNDHLWDGVQVNSNQEIPDSTLWSKRRG